ncbi:unnamed protein product [Mytilus coruscus]|uniref:MAM domain-containing protein n=1 Tax=Mytilus coruscus TaxID=42192 RepID=A0A6J8CWH6_MYTCO|nr:unnamed protein product [Mytilus coruscus]
MNYVWNYVLISWLLVKFLVLSVIPAQLEYTWVVDPDRDPSLLYCPDDALITILNISVKNEEYCGSQPCVIDDRDHEALKRLCDNSHFCLIYGSNFSSACLLGQRSFNMSYMCEAPVSLDCNFENDLLCNWEQGKEDEFDWTRNSGWTSTPSTGPFSDHTTKSVLSDGRRMA